MPSAGYSGKSVDARVCPRCQKQVGGFFAAGRWQPARHKASGKWCRGPVLRPQTNEEAAAIGRRLNPA